MAKTTSTNSSARDVFSYLFMIILLVIGVVGLSTLAWQVINYSFPDVLQLSYVNITDAARNAIASLVVAWPVFLLTSWLVGRDLKANPEKSDLWVRKWLMYLTLFVCGIAAIIDLITLLNYFLSGEITTRFILKVLVVLVIAGGVFGYYLWELRRSPTAKSMVPRASAVASSLLIVATIVTGFMVIGSPAHQRAVRLDGQRASDLAGLQNQIVSYWQTKSALPTKLTDMVDPISGYIAPTDPVTHEAYSYEKKGELTFELCATFAESSLPKELGLTGPEYYPMYPADAAMNNWQHTAGRICFTRTIDPQIYKTDKTIVPMVK